MEKKPGDFEGLAESSVKSLEREATAEATTKPTSEPAVKLAEPDEASKPEEKTPIPAPQPTVKVEESNDASTKQEEKTPIPVPEPSAITNPAVEVLPTPQSTAAAPVATKQAEVAQVDVPDPDEDDLDDLDDMLDEFTPTQPEPKLPTQPKPTTADDDWEEEEEDGVTDKDFAKQLQAGMAELLGDLGTSPEMQAQFESMLKELGGEAEAEAAAAAAQKSTLDPSSPSSSAPTNKKKKKKKTAKAPTATAEEESFQETIRKTMERLNVSGDQATAAAFSSDPSDDLMAEMLKAMQASGGGEGGEEDFSTMLLGMMEQLTNKEILYEPMKELDDKFPEWLKKNGEKAPKDDLVRYKEQQVYVKEIVARFEAKGYSDDNAADREYIVERMQKMQAAGSPPPDLVGDMSAAQEAFGGPPEEGCPQQ